MTKIVDWLLAPLAMIGLVLLWLYLIAEPLCRPCIIRRVKRELADAQDHYEEWQFAERTPETENWMSHYEKQIKTYQRRLSELS